MKIFRSLFLTITLISLCACASLREQANTFKVMSYNIRCGFCEQPTDINHWSKRKMLVADLIEKSGADIIGLQEAEKFQVLDLVQALPQYEWYGIGRDEGQTGEMNAILVLKSRFKIEDTKTIHLSPTPEQISLGWDARYKRTLTMAKLYDLNTQTRFNFFNSHFDHIGKIARLNSARLIIEEARKLDQEPIVLTGDFNDRPGFDGYKVLATELFDAAIISNREPKGGDISFNGFGKDLKPGNKIDYIFVSKHFEVKDHLINTTSRDGNFPSDHFPIISTVKLR